MAAASGCIQRGEIPKPDAGTYVKLATDGSSYWDIRYDPIKRRWYDPVLGYWYSIPAGGEATRQKASRSSPRAGKASRPSGRRSCRV